MFELKKQNLKGQLHENVKQCYICDTRFQRWNWRGNGRHQCRICSKAVCAHCSTMKIVGGEKIRCCIARCTQDLKGFQRELDGLFNEKWLLPILYRFYEESPLDLNTIVNRLFSGPVETRRNRRTGEQASSFIEVRAEPKEGVFSLHCQTEAQQRKLLFVLRVCFNIERYAFLTPLSVVLQRNVMQQMILIYQGLYGGAVPRPPAFYIPPACTSQNCYGSGRKLSRKNRPEWEEFAYGDEHFYRGTTFYCLWHYRFGFYLYHCYTPKMEGGHAPA
jgi:hypothetical protein